jgi:type IV pilus assembly protein PilN
MEFSTNLATRTYIDRRKLTVTLAVCLGILILLLIAGIQLLLYNAREIDRLNRLHQGTRTAARQEVPEARYQRLLADIKQANGIIEKKTFDWISLLDNLEQVVPSGVALNSVDPRLKERTLNLSGIAVSFKNIQELMRNLEASPSFSNVYLLSQSERITAGKQKGIAFNISCRWVL